MKTIKITALITLSLFYFSGLSQIKTHSVDVKEPSKTKLSLLGIAGDILIVAENTNKITISVEGIKPIPKRAEGLKRVGAGGEDNTGVGLNQRIEGNIIELTGAIPMSADTDYKISVPKNLKLNVELGMFTSGDLKITGLSSDIEVDVKNSDLKLKDVTGPTVINNLSGDILIEFSKVNQTSPFSIKAISGDIDISIPSNSPANLELSSMSGGIYTDFDLETDKSKSGNLKFIGGGSKVRSKINGGGVKFAVSAMSGNIYLRKK